MRDYANWANALRDETRNHTRNLAKEAGLEPEKLSLDHGYYSAKNLQELSDREVKAYVARDRGEVCLEFEKRVALT